MEKEARGAEKEVVAREGGAMAAVTAAVMVGPREAATVEAPEGK